MTIQQLVDKYKSNKTYNEIKHNEIVITVFKLIICNKVSYTIRASDSSLLDKNIKECDNQLAIFYTKLPKQFHSEFKKIEKLLQLDIENTETFVSIQKRLGKAFILLVEERSLKKTELTIEELIERNELLKSKYELKRKLANCTLV